LLYKKPNKWELFLLTPQKHQGKKADTGAIRLKKEKPSMTIVPFTQYKTLEKFFLSELQTSMI
jgi:hypothetical protein